MKRVLVITAGILACLVGYVVAFTTLPRTGLSIPQRGDVNWDAQARAFFTYVDTYGGFTNIPTTWSAAQVFPFGSEIIGAAEAVYDVRTYGAVCDGITDDAAAITATLAAAKADLKAAIIQFPITPCRVASSVVITDMPPFIIRGAYGMQTPISGDGTAIRGSTIIVDTANAAFDIQPVVGGPAGTWYGWETAAIENLRFDCATPGTGIGIKVTHGVQGPTLSRLTFSQCRLGVLIGNEDNSGDGAYNVLIRDSLFTGNTRGLLQTNSGSTGLASHVENTTFRGNTTHVELGHFSDWFFENDLFEASTETGILVRGNALLLERSHFEGNGISSGYDIDAADNGTEIGNLFVLENNSFSGMGAGSTASVYVHRTADPSGGFTSMRIQSNTWSSTSGVGIVVGPMGPGRGLFLQSNIISRGTPLDIDSGFTGLVIRMQNTMGAAGLELGGISFAGQAFTIADGTYLQIADANAGAPSGDDCNADDERGRLSIDTTNNRLMVCNGTTRGWDSLSLEDGGHLFAKLVYDFPDLDPGECEDSPDTTLAGSTDQDICVVGVPNSSMGGTLSGTTFSCWRSPSEKYTIRFCCIQESNAGDCDPPEGSYNVALLRYVSTTVTTTTTTSTTL